LVFNWSNTDPINDVPIFVNAFREATSGEKEEKFAEISGINFPVLNMTKKENKLNEER